MPTFDSTYITFDSTNSTFDNNQPKRYLVGTGATRNWSDPLNWSSTSGGAGGDLVGSEKITGGTFESGLLLSLTSTGSTGLVASWDLNTTSPISGTQDGRLIVTNAGSITTRPRLDTGFLGTTGKYYKITFDYKVNSGNCQFLGFNDGNNLVNAPIYITGVGSITRDILCTGGATSILGSLYFNGMNTFDIQIDNISIKEILTLPTVSDNVIIDNNSGICTLALDTTLNAYCYDLTCTNSQAVTISSAITSLYCYGSLTLNSNITWTFTSSAYMQLKATTSGNTITMNGCVPSFNRLYFDGVGGSWVNQDAMSFNGYIRHLNGHWNTNGKDINAPNSYYLTELGTKTLTLGASLLTIFQWANDAPTNFTFNKGISTVKIKALASSSISGVNNFYNLYIDGQAVITSAPLIYNNQTIDNVLTLTGNNSSNYRLLICSNTIGTPRTLTFDPTKAVFSNIDLRDITFTNAMDLSAITGGSGDCGGNSANITFTPASTFYYKHTSGACTTADTTKWFSDFARTTLGRYPLPQDSGVWDSASFTGASTLSFNCPRYGSIDMSGVNQAVAQSTPNNIEFYGNYILGNNITTSGGAIYSFGLTANLNLYGKNISSLYIMRGACTIIAPLVAYTLIQVLAGTLTFNTTNISTLYLYNAGSIGGSECIISLTRTSGNAYYGSGNVTGSLTMLLVPSSGSADIIFAGNAKTFNKVQFSGTHTGNFDITGNNTFAELIIDKGRKVRLTTGSTQTVAKITAKGTNTDKITIGSTGAASATIVYTGGIMPDIKFANISYITASTPFKVRASVDGGSNSGITFNPARYWVGASGNISDATKWSSTSGGVGGNLTDGVEKITNGSFATNSDWQLGSSWAISGGTANYDAINNTNSLIQIPNTNITIDKYYKLTFTISAGTARIFFNTGTVVYFAPNGITTAQNFAAGIYVFYLKALANCQNLRIITYNNVGGTAFSIDDISVQEIVTTPTSTEDVFFDENSLSGDSKTVTVDADFNCLSLDFEGLTNTMTLSSDTNSLFAYGGLHLSPVKLTWNFTGTAYAKLKGVTSFPIWMNGMTGGTFNRLYFDGVNGGWTNQDAMSFTGAIYHANGEWKSNNFNITTTGSYYFELGTKILTLGSSILTVNTYTYNSSANLTVNAGTSTIRIIGVNFEGLGKTYYNVELLYKGTTNVTGANTFNSLTVNTSNIDLLFSLQMSGNQIINNILTLTGRNSSNNRLLIASNTIGTPRTITCGSLVASNVDFRDITLVQLSGGLDANETDNLIIDLDKSTWGGTGKVLYLKGSNAAPTIASAAAILSLQNKSVTVTTN